MFSQQEEDLIISLHQALGNRWAQIASQLPGRTDNEIKNFWNSSLKKKLMKQGIDPNTHKPPAEAEPKSNLSLDLPTLSRLRGIPISSSSSIEMEPFSTSSFCDGEILTGTSSRENKQVFDPMLLYDFQSTLDPTRFNFNLLSQYRHQTPKPYHENNHLEVDSLNLNPGFGFTSMPRLANFVILEARLRRVIFSLKEGRISSMRPTTSIDRRHKKTKSKIQLENSNPGQDHKS